MRKYTVNRTDDGRFHFNLLSDDREVLLVSIVEHGSLDSVRQGIDLCCTNAVIRAQYTRHAAPGGQFFFILNARGRVPIARSRTFATAQDRDAAIEQCLECGGTSTVESE